MTDFKIQSALPKSPHLATLSLSESKGVGKKATLEQAANGFEAIFMKTMLQEMSDAKLDDGAFESEAEKPFTSMLHDKYADMASGKSGFGIADSIRRTFAKNVPADQQ
jgi:flagellar protein FlgJ